MSEAGLRKIFFDGWDGFSSHVEPRAGSTFGHPDSTLAYAGESWLVEFKEAGIGGKVNVRSTQKRWHREYAEHAFNAIFIVLYRDRLYRVPGRDVDVLHKEGLEPYLDGPSLDISAGIVSHLDLLRLVRGDAKA